MSNKFPGWHSLYLNNVRRNLAAIFDRSPLIKEPLSKSYGEHWLPARFGIKARLRGHAVACQEVATLSPDCAGSPVGQALKHASAALRPSTRAKAISLALRLASTCFRTRSDPIGLVQRFPRWIGVTPAEMNGVTISVRILRATRDTSINYPGVGLL